MDVDDAYAQVVGTLGRCQIGIALLNYIYGIVLGPQTLVVVFIGSSPSELNISNNHINNESSILVEWNLLDRQWIVDLILSFWFVGFLFGVVCFGQLSDSFGRRITMLAGFHVLMPVCLLTSFAYTWKIFAACRLLTGFVCGGVTLVQYVYTQEMLGRKWWTLNALMGSGMFATGLILLSFLAYLIPNWRNLLQLLAVMQILPMLCLWILPESPRWLYSNGFLHEAESILVSMGKWNGITNPIVQLSSKIEDTGIENYTLLDLFRNHITRNQALIMLCLWFVNSFVYYGLTMAAGDINDNLYLSEMMQALVEFPVLIFCASVLNKKWCGRKRALIGAFLMSGASCLILTIFDPTDRSRSKLAVGLAGKMMISASFSIVYLYSPELFPTCVRNVAMGVLSLAARIGGILASFSKSFVASSHIFAYLLFGSSGMAAGFLALLLPETLGLKTPDSFQDLSEQHNRSTYDNTNLLDHSDDDDEEEEI